MPDLLVSKKYLMFRYLGASLSINLTNFPGLTNVLKIVTFTPASDTGQNAQTAALGAANGQTVGGTLKTLATNDCYYLVSAATGWTLPNAIEVTQLGFTPANVILADADGYTPVANTRPISQADLMAFLRPGPSGLDALIASLGGGSTPAPTLGTSTVSFGAVAATSIVVNWTAVANATSYTVKRGTQTIYTGPLLTFTDSGLTAGTAYTYSVVPTATGYANGNAGTASTSTAATSGGSPWDGIWVDTNGAAVSTVIGGKTFTRGTEYVTQNVGGGNVEGGAIGGTTNQSFFQTSIYDANNTRIYTFPIPASETSVRLFFYTYAEQAGSLLNLVANGTAILTSFDVSAAVNGTRKAYFFAADVPVVAGKVVFEISSGTGVWIDCGVGVAPLGTANPVA